MVRVISVRFRTGGKIYFFDPLDFDIKKDQHVIVETARGMEYGHVVSDIREVEESRVVQPLKPVLRVATPEDDKTNAENLAKKDEARRICIEKIKKHELDMKLVDVEYTFDNNKVLFYFTADGRIDFRELVKDLAAVFKTRIELRQIGVRDEIKIMGGIGVCGRVLCCHSYLSEFVPVSIKMAKEQNLSLNPTKISGVCGRLMCCLKNEEEIYEELNKKLPNVGDSVSTQDGLHGEVHSVNVLRQLVKVVVEVGDEKEIKEYHADELVFRKKGRGKDTNLSPEELAELERLERQEAEDAKKEEAENPKKPHYEKKKHEGQERQHHDRKENHRDFQKPVAEQGENKHSEGNKPHFEKRNNNHAQNGQNNQAQTSQERSNSEKQPGGKKGKYFRNRKNRPYRHDKQEGKHNEGGN